MAFPAFEVSARTQHMARMEQELSTAELEAEVVTRMADSTRAAEQQFLRPLDRLRVKMARLKTGVDEYRARLDIFERDYKGELNALFDTKSVLMDECRSLQAAKEAAYADRAQAADDLDSWHSKSNRTFFGNRGQKLPNHSFFGQSLGDRDGLKSDRDAAGDEIARCKYELASKYREVGQIRERIDTVKADRQVMFNLRQQGSNRHVLQSSIDVELAHLWELEQHASRLQLGFDEFMKAAKHRTGTVSIEAEIEKVQARREDFHHAFSRPNAIAAREAQHRREWLDKRLGNVADNADFGQ